MRFVVLISVLAACGPSNRNGDDTPDSQPAICDDGAHQCGGSVYQVCVGGQWSIQEECQVACDAQLGCVNCAPGATLSREAAASGANSALIVKGARVCSSVKTSLV